MELPDIDGEVLFDVSGGDTEFEREILLEFIQSARQMLRVIEAAASTDDLQTLQHASHSLKGAAASVGAARFAAVCEELQSADSGAFAGVEPLIWQAREALANLASIANKMGSRRRAA